MNDHFFGVALEQELDVAEEEITAWVLEEHRKDFPLFGDAVAIGSGPETPEAQLSPHQFTQLVTAAKEIASVPAVISYLRYQIARAPGQEVGWRWHDVGEQIVALLAHPIRGRAARAAQRAAERTRGSGVRASDEELRQAWVELTCRFLALLRRRFMQRVRDLSYQRGEGT